MLPFGHLFIHSQTPMNNLHTSATIVWLDEHGAKGGSGDSFSFKKKISTKKQKVETGSPG